MTNANYHHGNLRSALIEAGIQIINESGVANLSLRKVANMCQVSAAAPYAHFKNKEELIQEMQEHVTKQFIDVLETSIAGLKPGTKEVILALGEAYVNFFIEHPTYFKFLFFTPYLSIQLSANEPHEAYPPYELFHKHAVAFLKNKGYDDTVILPKITNMWATVQGIALLATSTNVLYDGSFQDDLYRILTNGEA